MRIAIATDTNSGITRDTISAPDLDLLPMPVIIEEEMFTEGIDISHKQLYDAMAEHKNISSSQPSPGEVMGFWDKILEDGYDEIVYIPMSSGLSSSCYSAMQFAEDYDGKVQVVDNHRISVLQQESVYSACKLAAQGYSAKEIKDYLEERAYNASIYITVDSMEYLKKGGRVTPAAATFATVLNLKPVLTIQGDKLDTYKKARGMRAAQSIMIEAIKEELQTRFGEVPPEYLIVATAGTYETEELANKWRQMVQDAFPDKDVRYYNLPCSIASHVGMNAAGIGIIQKEVL